jgi:hypothetical protein
VSFFFHFSISGMFSSAETVTTWIPPVEWRRYGQKLISINSSPLLGTRCL